MKHGQQIRIKRILQIKISSFYYFINIFVGFLNLNTILFFRKNKPFMLTKGSNKKKNISSNIISSLNPKNLFTVSNEIVSKFEKKKKPFKANNQVNTKLNNESPETLESTITTTTSVSSAFISRAFISKMSKIISLI
jgi:hypothetical protein